MSRVGVYTGTLTTTITSAPSGLTSPLLRALFSPNPTRRRTRASWPPGGLGLAAVALLSLVGPLVVPGAALAESGQIKSRTAARRPARLLFRPHHAARRDTEPRGRDRQRRSRWPFGADIRRRCLHDHQRRLRRATP